MSQRLQEFTTYRRGATGQVSWFGPVQRPRLGPLGSMPVRYGDTMWLPVPGWGDSGSGHIGDSHGNFGVKNLMTLYQGDRELDQGNIEKLLPSGLAPQRLPYRLVVDNDRGEWGSPYSRHTLTEWNFTSQETGTETTLPLIQLDYGVRTDPAGRADRNGHLTVTASHLGGVTGTVKRPSVELSYDDGATWRRAAPDRHGDEWRTMLRAPKRATFVTVRVAARDDDGNSVSQTLVRAFGLR
ncbi:hypothetical protein ACWCXS_31745 [Streptomyces sp. NPDC001685]